MHYVSGTVKGTQADKEKEDSSWPSRSGTTVVAGEKPVQQLGTRDNSCLKGISEVRSIRVPDVLKRINNIL